MKKIELLKTSIESKLLVYHLYNTYKLYFKHGARSSKKVDYFHNFIKEQLETIFSDKKYTIKLEQSVKSINSSGKKRCDIVVFKNNKPYIIFPVKLCMSNYKQNKNNGWENLTGELMHLKWANNDIKIIPINIYMSITPYLKCNKIIKKFEKITYNDIKNYEVLIDNNIVYDNINYIVDVIHLCKEDEEFCKLPTIIQFNKKTKYRRLYEILIKLI